MITLTWILGIVSTLGIGGVIAAYFLLPAAAPLITSAVRALLRCRPCLYALAILAALLAAFWSGHHVAVVACRADEMAAELANKQADLDNAVQAKNDAAKRAALIEATANDQQTKDAKYIASLKKRPNAACALDDSDIGTGGMRNHGFNLPHATPGAR
jgi:apolipoprotein N-acyltransferase